jgi:hypothetical protein
MPIGARGTPKTARHLSATGASVAHFRMLERKSRPHVPSLGRGASPSDAASVPPVPEPIPCGPCAYGDAYRAKYTLSFEQGRAPHAIETCRTTALGGHVGSIEREPRPHRNQASSRPATSHSLGRSAGARPKRSGCHRVVSAFSSATKGGGVNVRDQALSRQTAALFSHRGAEMNLYNRSRMPSPASAPGPSLAYSQAQAQAGSCRQQPPNGAAPCTSPTTVSNRLRAPVRAARRAGAARGRGRCEERRAGARRPAPEVRRLTV